MKRSKPNKKNKFTFKKRKNYQEKLADSLVSTHERNEKLREKKISTSFLKNF